MNHYPEITTKKAAKQAGLYTAEQWFKKYRTPFPNELPVVIKDDEYYWEGQTEELFSKSRGQKDIGPLCAHAVIVGVKRLPRRTVMFPVYRQSDFQFREKIQRKIAPPRKVDLLDAIWAATCTAKKFEFAAKESKAKGTEASQKRGRGFGKRSRNLMALVDAGIQMAINREEVKHVGNRGKTHRYFGDGYLFRSKTAPPDWLTLNNPVARSVSSTAENRKPAVRLMDAVFTLEQIRANPTLADQ